VRGRLTWKAIFRKASFVVELMMMGQFQVMVLVTRGNIKRLACFKK